MLALSLPLLIFSLQAFAGEKVCFNGEMPVPESSLAAKGFSAPPEAIDLPSGWALLEFYGRRIPIPVASINKIAVMQNYEKIGSIALSREGEGTLWVHFSDQLSDVRDLDTPTEDVLEMAIQGRFPEVNELHECVVKLVANLILDLFSTNSSSGAYRLNDDLVINEKTSEEEEKWSFFWRNDQGRLVHASYSLRPEQRGLLTLVEEERGERNTSTLQTLFTCAEQETFQDCSHINSTEFEITFWNERLEQVNHQR